jgi:hypothetical protein
MRYSAIVPIHFARDMLPSSSRIVAVATFAAACACRLSNQAL